jgi:hypothetical protein
VDLDLLRLLQERERRLDQQARIEAERTAAEQGRIQSETTAEVEAARAAAEERARAETSRARITQLAGALRAFYHRKQAAFFTSPATLRATKKTRRCGATTGGCREIIARAIEIPRFRAVYATTTRIEAKARAWRNDTQSGFVDVIERYGERLKGAGVPRYDLGSVIVEVREGDLALVFSNGSLIELFGADDEGAIMKLRGLAKHVYWIDEAQDFSWLERFYKAVVVAGMNDFGGECWLTGTPGRDPVGMFYEVTRDDDVEARLAGWEIHEITVTDNPFFGRVVWERGRWFVEDNLYDQGAERSTHAWTGEIAAGAHRWGPFDDEGDAEAAAVKVRWERGAGATIRKNGWADDDPDAVREFKGRWVSEGARYVYPVHSVPPHQLLFAPQRLRDNPLVGSDPRFDGHPPWYDHVAAVRDLPRIGRDRRPHKWLYSLWFDFGFWPDPFAAVLWAFTPTLNDVYEMFSWKQTKVHADDQARYIKLLWDVEPAIVSFGGDAAGKQADFAEWSRRLNLPLEEANKQGKNTLEELLAGDIRRGLVHLREGSPLYTEMRHLVYLPTAPGKPRQVHKHRAVNGIVHGDHACDAARYGFAALTHYLSQLGTERPPPGSRQAYEQEAERLERDLDQREARREAALEAADELAEEYGRSEYQWDS